MIKALILFRSANLGCCSTRGACRFQLNLASKKYSFLAKIWHEISRVANNASCFNSMKLVVQIVA